MTDVSGSWKIISVKHTAYILVNSKSDDIFLNVVFYYLGPFWPLTKIAKFHVCGNNC